jgi:hypothetical protein
MHGGKGNSYGKKEQFLHAIFREARECKVLELEGSIVGMCGSLLELHIHEEPGCKTCRVRFYVRYFPSNE